ncbi:hypothetical protein BIV25_35345 [Streptomyces sp. MUSC 14]|nr:hypothetical protein BIV25_35345 [Streptomyces sp. MUSC 14]
MNLVNDSDRHTARMMCVMALKSSEDTARRVARMHLATAQDGRTHGRIAYGWIRKGPSKGQLVEDEAKVVADIFKDCLTGETAYAIATQLNRRGVTPPAAKQWSSTMVDKMLRNPRHAGLVAYSGKPRVAAATAWDGWSKVIFDDDGRPLAGCWTAIVSPKTWSQVQFELQPRRHKQGLPAGTHRPAVAVKYELSGILTCGFCKRGLVGHKSNEGKNHYYRCPATAHGGCGKTHIAAEPVEDAIATGMTAFLARLLQASEAAPAPAPEKIAAGSHRRCRAELTT